LDTLDLISAKLHRDTRPLDFTAILELDAEEAVLAGLNAGALSAGRTFPASVSRVVGRRWERTEESPLRCVEANADQVETVVSDFVNGGKDPHEDIQVRQLLIRRGDGVRPLLLTRFHHCAMDGTSAGLWMFHQMMVASGEFEVETEWQTPVSPVLQTHPDHQRKAPTAHWGASRRLYSPNCRPSRERQWCAFQVESAPIRDALKSIDGVTYNDYLAAQYLQAMKEWNADHDRPSSRLSVWLPMNIREQAFVGFGNGSSRVRVYADAIQGDNAKERSREFRSALNGSRHVGEWHIPAATGLLSLPDFLMVPILRAYLNRPGVDMGSAPFTHMERMGSMSRFLRMVTSARWVMMLHPRYPLGVAAASVRDHTEVTLTHDPQMLSADQALEFMDRYQRLILEGQEAF